ncbi:MAG: flagellar basal body protein [Prevotella sp.]|nr:flagellar basal body protein [Prevotella sp.]
MASSFMGLYVQREAILLAQKALDITGNNISNINTPGYTRQRVDICSVANKAGTLGYSTGVTLAGRGSEAIGVAQVRDRLRDRQVRTYSGDLCNIGIKMETLSDVEDVFDSIEADELNASFAAIVSKFKAALQGFSADNADRSELANVAKNTAESVVQCVVSYNTKLNDISENTLEDAEKTVNRINKIFTQMGNLNKQIKEAYVSMGYMTPTLTNYEVMNNYGPLELKDDMNSLLDELSQYGNISFEEQADGTFTVEFANQKVVEDKYYAQMAITQEHPDPTQLEYEITKTLMDKDDWYDLHVANGTGGIPELLVRGGAAGETVNISGKTPAGDYLLDSGSLRGYLDVYNGRGIYAHAGTEFEEPVYSDDAVADAKAMVDSANAILQKIAGGTATDDDILQLRNLIGADVQGTAAPYTVTLGGTELVNGTSVSEIKTKDDAAGNPVFYIDDGAGGETEVTLAGDAAAKLTDINNAYKGIEYYRDMLNAFVKTATEEFNAIFADFKDEDGNPQTLFEYGDDFRTAAQNFRVSENWEKNPEFISNPSGDNKYEELDNVYINKMLGVLSVPHKYGDGVVNDPQEFSLEKYVAHICDDLGTKLSEEKGMYDATDVTLTTAETLRSEVMDVSMDEEGINMMNYQKWYNAIARMITTMDEALEKLINSTGLVGLR